MPYAIIRAGTPVMTAFAGALEEHGIQVVNTPPPEADVIYGVGEGAAGVELARTTQLDKLLLIAPYTPPAAETLPAFAAPVLAYAFDEGADARRALDLFRAAQTELRIYPDDDFHTVLPAALRWLTDNEPTEIA